MINKPLSDFLRNLKAKDQIVLVYSGLAINGGFVKFDETGEPCVELNGYYLAGTLHTGTITLLAKLIIAWGK